MESVWRSALAFGRQGRPHVSVQLHAIVSSGRSGHSSQSRRQVPGLDESQAMTTRRQTDARSKLDIPLGECKVCGQGFIKRSTLHSICSKRCLLSIPAIEAKKDRQRREALKSRSDWLKETQVEFNRYIRVRDAGMACISCGRVHEGQWHAGHYLSTGARPELRFDPRNVHKQCQPCNTHLHGNLVLYRVALLAKLGAQVVEELEGPHEPKHYSVDDLKALKAKFRALSREIEKERQ